MAAVWIRGGGRFPILIHGFAWKGNKAEFHFTFKNISLLLFSCFTLGWIRQIRWAPVTITHPASQFRKLHTVRFPDLHANYSSEQTFHYSHSHFWSISPRDKMTLKTSPWLQHTVHVIHSLCIKNANGNNTRLNRSPFLCKLRKATENLEHLRALAQVLEWIASAHMTPKRCACPFSRFRPPSFSPPGVWEWIYGRLLAFKVRSYGKDISL